MQTVYLGNDTETLFDVYGPRQRARIAQLVGMEPPVLSTKEQVAQGGRDAEIAFCTWGNLRLSEEEIASWLPNLKAVFYAAGSVQGFARPYFARGVRIFSAWHANAVPVAEYTFAQVLLATKGFFQVQPLTRKSRSEARRLFEEYPGNYGVKVGLLGCGAIGRLVAEMLRGTALDVLVFDPFLPQAEADKLGVRLASMEEIFSTCIVVSNHLANLPATQGIIQRGHFMSMPPYATFINTGRGAQLNEQDLYDALVQDPTRTALLDVLIDEPAMDQNPLNRLGNCFITPHIAGSSGLEKQRMADYMADAFIRYEKGETCPYEVSLKMLETMA